MNGWVETKGDDGLNILHIFPNEKFTVDYVMRIRRLFKASEHTFYIFSNNHNICSHEDLPYDEILWGELFDDKQRLKMLFEENDRIILHSLLFDKYKQLQVIACLVQKYCNKVLWTVWGADLYNQYNEYHNSLNPKKVLKEYQRKKLILNLHGVVAGDDYPELLKRYKTHAKNYYAMYSYQFIDSLTSEHSDGLVHIMVGHSATDTCQHIEVFERLKPCKDKIKIYCPLSYPANTEYINMVCKYGNELFGEHFVPMTQFMKYSEYVAFLNQIDIGIFNNNRQQGNGNITNLLYLGKKIYMASENTLLKTYRDLGASIYDYNQIDDKDLLEPLPVEDSENNRKIIIERYSDENFYKCWNSVFTE